MLRGVLFVFLFCVCASAQAHGLLLDFNVASVHSRPYYYDQGQKVNYNQNNPGLGITFVDGDLRYKLGEYKNSYKKTSIYAAASWLPLTIHPNKRYGNFQIAHTGVTFGYVSGYHNTIEQVPIIVPMLLVTTEFSITNRLILNASYLPAFKKGSISVWMFQVEFRIK